MKKIIVLISLSLSLFAVQGNEVFQKNCTACHFGMISVKEFMPYMKKGEVKAPPMVEISSRLKSTIVINAKNDNASEIHRFTVIAFIKEYLKQPSWDHYICDNSAINRFDVMPKQSHLSEEELQAVAEWVYDEFEGKEFK